MHPGITNLFEYLLRKFREEERSDGTAEGFVKFANEHLKFNGVSTTVLAGPGNAFRLADGTIVSIGEIGESDDFKMDDGAVNIISEP